VRAAARGVNRLGPFVYGSRRAAEGDPTVFHGWCLWNGTSFAAPVVTGVVAAFLGKHPKRTGTEALEHVLADAPVLKLEPEREDDHTTVRFIDPKPVWPKDDRVPAT
jgi:hypothetical protein